MLEFSIRDTFSATIVLFAVLDILGSIPIVMAMRDRGTVIKPFQTALVAFIILLTFMFLGEAVLGFFGVDINSFAVAGAFVLFILGLEMVLGKDIIRNDNMSSASIVPLAFPLLAGPGSFTTLLSLRAEFDTLSVVAALIINTIIVYVVLSSVDFINKLIGANGIYVLKKFFGIILLAIAVRLFASNLSSLMSHFG
ncbi:MAG: MarC family protein [Bacteroidales bacterium]|jgi:multiple antibiotic resistance protein|nr:MarC family protein [Bacteroidales bacterium]